MTCKDVRSGWQEVRRGLRKGRMVPALQRLGPGHFLSLRAGMLQSTLEGERKRFRAAKPLGRSLRWILKAQVDYGP